MPEPIFYRLLDSGFVPSALSLRLNYRQRVAQAERALCNAPASPVPVCAFLPGCDLVDRNSRCSGRYAFGDFLLAAYSWSDFGSR